VNAAVDAVSQRYADALYGLAARKGVLETVVRDVERLAAEFASAGVRSVLLNPRFSGAERLAKLAPVLAGLDPLTQNFVRLLYDRNREQVLASIGVAFRARRLAEAGAVEGVVESARALEARELETLKSGLERRLGATVLLENRVLPELIGGVRVRIGSKMIDLSVSGRLHSLRERLERVPLTGVAAG
jgi:F-type H+-transporting ATPase subunit delta